ncbi:MAG TPA: adenylate kinase [Candidatus Cloacimonadota bacterium]|nr:adenylate kinase [Candidatus Cloacimonadota bacterium]
MKIWVRGVSCSGKSTLAKKLAEELNIKHIELDHLHWLPGWQERDKHEFAQLVRAEISHGHWIIDGNYSKIHQLVNFKQDLIVWLDYPLPVLLWRCTKRTLGRICFKKKVCNGNIENLSSLFSRDSLYLWILKTYQKRKNDLKTLIEKNEKVCVIRSQKDIDQLLLRLKKL